MNILKALLITTVGIFLLHLNTSGGLGSYIHPRYFLLSNFAGITCLIVGLLDILSNLEHKWIHFRKIRSANLESILNISWIRENISKTRFSLALVTWFVVLIGLFMPAFKLSPRAASQRIRADFNFNYVIGDTDTRPFFSETNTYGIADWIGLITIDPNLANYESKEATVEGFIFALEEFDENIFMISRYVVSCCVVDSTPLGLFVEVDWRENFTEREWVRVHGYFKIGEVEGQKVLIIVADNIEEIEVPEIQYIYI